MLKIACFFTGENYGLLSTDTPQSKKKVISMAIAMMVPTILWVISGYLLVSNVLRASFWKALLAALICGLLVFIIEKLIIMSTASKGLSHFRVALGIFVAILGSLVIDEVLFKDDIDVEVARIKTEGKNKAGLDAEKLFKLENNYELKRRDLDKATLQYNESITAVVAETDGSRGTGRSGVGTVARFKNQIAGERQLEMVRLQQDMKLFDSAKVQYIETSKNAFETSFNGHALLIRIKAMYSLVFSNFWMFAYYLVITAILFLIEFLVVILKSKMEKTNYERRLEMIEQIGAKRIEFLSRDSSPLNDPGMYMKYYGDVRNAINRGNKLFN